MPTIDQVLKYFQSLNVQTAVKETIEENKQNLLYENMQQLSAGLDSEGNSLQPLYSQKYAVLKGTNVPNLYKTGAFYNSLQFNEQYNIVSNVSYAKHLINRYGAEILGVNNDAVGKYSSQIKEKIRSLK